MYQDFFFFLSCCGVENVFNQITFFVASDDRMFANSSGRWRGICLSLGQRYEDTRRTQGGGAEKGHSAQEYVSMSPGVCIMVKSFCFFYCGSAGNFVPFYLNKQDPCFCFDFIFYFRRLYIITVQWGHSYCTYICINIWTETGLWFVHRACTETCCKDLRSQKWG